jgi:hypothetical protein
VAVLEAAVATLQTQLAAVQSGVLAYMSVDPNVINGLAGPHVIFTGVNVHVRSGSGATNDSGSLTGLGNLIVGYNEGPSPCSGIGERPGSHNLVVGDLHSYSSHSALIGGSRNTVGPAARWAHVVGECNTVGEWFASVTGGLNNAATGQWSHVSGGSSNEASAVTSVVSAGFDNVASGGSSSVSGGSENVASGDRSSVSGGTKNEASGVHSSVSGGEEGTASGDRSSVTGGLANVAFGPEASVTGGWANTASGQRSTVSGGAGREATGFGDWVAGTLSEDF